MFDQSFQNIPPKNSLDNPPPIKYNQQENLSDAETERIKEIEDELINAFIPPCNDQYPAEISRVMRAFP